MAPAIASPPSSLVDEKRAAEILGITAGTLSVWRCVRRYPLPYTKIGRAVRYDVAQLQEFIRSRTVAR
jgi:predicted DNA-binding transcriptional regulator AlpA